MFEPAINTLINYLFMKHQRVDMFLLCVKFRESYYHLRTVTTHSDVI